MTNLLPFKARRGGFLGSATADATIADLDLIHSISVALIGELDLAQLYGKIVKAAIAITRSQFGTMQLVVPSNDGAGRGGHLRLLYSQGLPDDAIAFWQWVSPFAHSSCTAALKTGQRAIIADYEQWDQIAGTPDLEAFRRTGIRSAQTTPLLSRKGDLLGMISTHWDVPHQPSERDLRLLDILARQAADLLERTIAEDTMRARKEELDLACQALRESEALQTMLADELSHRVKNMLATVQAISKQTLRGCGDLAEFVESFGGRIQSMARVHSQLSTNDWKGTQLRAIVEDQLKLGPVDERQIIASGPDIYLEADAVAKVAMILHELGTNSLKYGALSRPTGRVLIDWIVGSRKIEFCWIEQGGPKIEPGVKRGFGSRLIEASVRGEHGRAEMSVGPDGIRWDICFPLAACQSLETDGEGPEPALPVTHHHADGKSTSISLAGKRILVVEDEPLLAMDVVSQLEDAGAKVVGTAADPETALSWIDEFRLDGVLLDANLGGSPVGEVANALAEKQIPFAFMSGYDRKTLPNGFDLIPLLPKPFTPRELLEVSRDMVG